MRNKNILVCVCALILSTGLLGQVKKPTFSVSGTAGVNYEYYGLSRKPSGWTGFTPRKPWNQVRFNFSPEMQFGKDFSSNITNKQNNVFREFDIQPVINKQSKSLDYFENKKLFGG